VHEWHNARYGAMPKKQRWKKCYSDANYLLGENFSKVTYVYMYKCTYVYVYNHIFETSKHFYLYATYLLGTSFSKVKYAYINLYICIYKILNIHICILCTKFSTFTYVYLYIHIFKISNSAIRMPLTC